MRPKQNSSNAYDFHTTEMPLIEELNTSASDIRLSRANRAFRIVSSFPVLLGVLLVLGVFVGCQLFFVEGDTWLHIALGREIMAIHAWPTTDSYSFTAQGKPAITTEWLCDLIMAAADRLAGSTGLMLLLMALGAVLVLLVYYYAYLRSGNSKAAFVATMMLLPLLLPFLRLRPQLVGYIFLLITLICLEVFRAGNNRALWILPGIFLVWVNTHGTFLFGLLVLGISGAAGLFHFSVGGLRAERWSAKQWRQLIRISLLSVLTLGLTPYGIRLAMFTLSATLHSPLGMTKIGEYQPLGAFGELLRPFLAFIVLLILAGLTLRLTYRLDEVGLLLLSIYLACVHARLLLLFVLAFAPFLASLLSRWIPNYQPSKDHFVLNAFLIILVGVTLVRYFPVRQTLQGKIAEEFPAQAVEYLRQHPVEGSMLNQYKWGGYLMWTMGPEHKIFIDGRSVLYEAEGVYPDYLHIINLGPKTLSLLAKYGIQSCLIEPAEPLATLLRTMPQWERLYEDKVSVIFARKDLRKRSGALATGRSGLAPSDGPNHRTMAIMAECLDPLRVSAIRYFEPLRFWTH